VNAAGRVESYSPMVVVRFASINRIRRILRLIQRHFAAEVSDKILAPEIADSREQTVDGRHQTVDSAPCCRGKQRNPHDGGQGPFSEVFE
jgi:hypothetical protein